ncbi:MAG TPA: V-type ATPase subunit [Firmicutes bacterium]|nr:V-type ATPase subunit [Candidatus Fermentithermobacillaceae bacterium]
MDEYNWASSVGHVRILELGLLTGADFSKLAETEDLRAAVSALRDTDYGKQLEALGNLEEFGPALERALGDEYEYVLSFSPEPGPILCFLSKYDFHNLKVLAKELLLGMPMEPRAVSPLSIIPFDDLRGACAVIGEDGIPSLLPQLLERARSRYGARNGHGEQVASFVSKDLVPALVNTFEEARRQGLEEGGPFGVDSSIDRGWMSWVSGYYRKRGYELLANFAAAEADLTNLRIVMRSLFHGLDPAVVTKILLPGGTISPRDIGDAYAAGPEALERVYLCVRWVELFRRGLERVQRRESLTEWEKECEDTLVEIYRMARTRALGPEPVLGFLYGKENEVKNLRIVLSGKQSLAPKERILARIRRSYA